MSKSRGTFIKARTYIDHLDPEYLRYYLAARLAARIDDSDLNFEDFTLRVNADLVGKVVNIASRCAGFINKRFEGKLADTVAEPELYRTFVEGGEAIAEHFEAREYLRAIRDIMALADRANQYIDEKAPWVIAKQAEREQELHDVLDGLQTANLYGRISLVGKLKEVLSRHEQFKARYAEFGLPRK